MLTHSGESFPRTFHGYTSDGDQHGEAWSLVIWVSAFCSSLRLATELIESFDTVFMDEGIHSILMDQPTWRIPTSSVLVSSRSLPWTGLLCLSFNGIFLWAVFLNASQVFGFSEYSRLYFQRPGGVQESGHGSYLTIFGVVWSTSVSPILKFRDQGKQTLVNGLQLS